MAKYTLRRMVSSDDRELSPFLLRNVDGLDSSSVDGSGAYGIVYKVTVKGVQCIAKRPHSIFLDRLDSDSKKVMKEKFRNECILLSKLQHPNIVCFVGVHSSRSKDLTLIMELLHTDLAKFVESTSNIALSIKLSILLDVTYGMLYLHSLDTPVIHRDLTAPNVLLTSDLRAKIADLGVAKLIDPTTESRIFHTQTPGTQNYMPPEALMQNPSYSAQLDVFSFGHLSLYTVNQNCPKVYSVETTTRMVKDGSIELMRRQEALMEMGREHPLYGVVEQCLSDKPEKRPSTSELHSLVQQLCGRHPKSIQCVPQALGFSAQDLREEVKLTREALAEKSKQIETLQGSLASAEQLKNEALEKANVYELQATVFETDFNQERKDRERAVSEKSDLQKENQDLIKQNEDHLVENKHLKGQLDAVMMHNRLLKSSLDEQQRSISSQNSKEPKDKHEQVDKFSQCLLLKEEGNALYKAGEHHKAADKYHEALIYLEELVNNEEPQSSAWINIMEIKVVVLLNFSQCKLLFGEYNEVISHTSSILEFDSENVKALFRRGKANAALCNVDKAKADFEEVMRLDTTLCRSVEKELASLKVTIREREAETEKKWKENCSFMNMHA